MNLISSKIFLILHFFVFQPIYKTPHEPKEMINNWNRIRSGWDVCIIGGGATGLGCGVMPPHGALKQFWPNNMILRKALLLALLNWCMGVCAICNKEISNWYWKPYGKGAFETKCAAPGKKPILHGPKLQMVGGPLFYGIGLKVYDWMSGRLRSWPSEFLIQRRNP